MTTHNIGDYRQRAVDAGIDGLITKPCTLDAFRNALRAVAPRETGPRDSHFCTTVTAAHA